MAKMCTPTAFHITYIITNHTLWYSLVRWIGLLSYYNWTAPEFVFVYIDVCAFPSHVQSTEFTTGGLQSSCRNFSRMVSGNRMHLSKIFCFMAKAVNTYVHDFYYYYFMNLQRFQTNFFHFVILGYCLWDFEENNELNQFWNKAVT